MIAAASETIAFNRNDGNNGDNGDSGEGAAINVAVALGTTTAAVTTSQRAIISSDAKSSLHEYVDEEEWPLIRALMKGLISLVVGLVKLLLVAIKSPRGRWHNSC